MKKITSLLLILVMMLTMCTACDTGSSKRDRDRDEDREEREDRDDEDEDEEEEEDEEIDETEETTESEETLPERTVATTETEATTEPTDETADPVESYQNELDAILGEIDAAESEAQGYVDVENNCYVNETIGIRFNIPEGWTYQSAAELAGYGEAVGDVIEDTGTGLSAGGSAYAFLANSPDGAHSINMIHDQNSLILPGNEQTLITSTLASQDQLIATYEAMGLTDVSMTESELEIAGETISTIETTYSYSGMTVSTVQFFLIGTGGNYLTVSLQSIDMGSGVSDFDFASAFETI